jgi:hypothetical protein
MRTTVSASIYAILLAATAAPVLADFSFDKVRLLFFIGIIVHFV